MGVGPLQFQGAGWLEVSYVEKPKCDVQAIGGCDLFDNYQSNDTKKYPYKMKLDIVKRMLETTI